MKAYSMIRPYVDAFRYQLLRLLRYKRMCELQKQDKITCAFFVLSHAVWKCDYIFKKMLADKRFDPVIVICPVVNYGKSNMIMRIKQCEDFFKEKGYDYITTYSQETDTYVDIKSVVNPDVIFYTNPYRGLIDDRYFVDKFKDTLSIYIPYCIGECIGTIMGYGLEMHNIVWRKYAETEFHKSLAKQFSARKGKNVVVTGYPGIEAFLDSTYMAVDSWPEKQSGKKRIIWAPHHTIEPVGHVNYSCFIRYAEYMVNMARKYANDVQFVFKPHPLLRNKLNLLWGKERTDEYYELWENMQNTGLNDGEYIDLFMTSDAMIHDSGSFIAEYLYVNKPVMRTMNGVDPKAMFSDFGLACLDQYYFAYNEQDIENFIQNVIKGIDPLRQQRTKFIREVLVPKNGNPSDNIINDIVDSIKNRRV